MKSNSVQIIELELNKYYVEEAKKQIQMTNTFLPDHFTKRGGIYVANLPNFVLFHLFFTDYLDRMIVE